ncbi:MAG: hypothetical protein Q8L02_03885 [Candidatus Nitrotoga sp.]|nr:hypothetical protein [Candidatus Nitrotoga sp.]
MYNLVYPPENPCGCGSGREFGKCCLKDGQIILNPKLLNPPKPKAWHRNKKCILNWTSDCCSKISGDHIVSKSVLKVISKEKITISTSSFSREHSINSDSLKTKQLCRRHNSALSPIDSQTARFFKAFVAINNSLTWNFTSQKLYFFHGIDIERWMLKTMLMAYYAKLSNVTPENYKLPENSVKLFQFDLGQPYGLYVPTSINPNGADFFITENSTSVCILTEGEFVSGVRISLGGFSLTLVIYGNEDNFYRLSKSYTYRPKNLLFFRGQEVYAIQTAFPNCQGKDIWISYGNPHAEMPSSCKLGRLS